MSLDAVARGDLICMPLSDIDVLRLEFIHKMEADTLCAALIMMPKGHVLMHIPVFIGRDIALDDAVRCISRKAPTHDTSCGSSYDPCYVIALRSLQTALNDPLRIQAVETLAAASLLQMYEAVKDPPQQKWIHHARGVIRMLQTRHITSDASVLERAILGVQVGTVFLSTVTTDDGAFLSRHAWLQMPCRKSIGRGTKADLFTRLIVDGRDNLDKDEFFIELLGGCRFNKAATDIQRIRIMDVGTSDMLSMRQILLRRTHEHLPPNGSSDALCMAADVVYGCFLIVTTTFILIMQEQSRNISKYHQPSKHIDEVALKSDRSEALISVSATFGRLASIDQELSRQIAAALSIVLSVIVASDASNHYGDKEAAELLEIVERELHNITHLSRSDRKVHKIG